MQYPPNRSHAMVAVPSSGKWLAAIGILVICLSTASNIFSAKPNLPRKPGEPEKFVSPAFERRRPTLTPGEVKQCLQCHQVQRGELLGAFTYELHRKAGRP